MRVHARCVGGRSYNAAVVRYIAILEDNILRIAEMRACLLELLPQYRVVVFDDATQMIAWLRDDLANVVLISLDHDLPITQDRGGTPIVCGNGRDIVHYLAQLPPVCPVIVHSANLDCAVAMEADLNHVSWPAHRVTPHDGEAWITRDWVAAIRQFLADGLIFA